jgi:hypothetical protein
MYTSITFTLTAISAAPTLVWGIGMMVRGDEGSTGVTIHVLEIQLEPAGGRADAHTQTCSGKRSGRYYKQE